MKPTRSEGQETEKQWPGAFLADGSFKEQAFLGERGETDTLVRSLLQSRMDASFKPSEAVALIRSAGVQNAFPWLNQWEEQTDWRMCWNATSAETVVKHAGKGWEASR